VWNAGLNECIVVFVLFVCLSVYLHAHSQEETHQEAAEKVAQTIINDNTDENAAQDPIADVEGLQAPPPVEGDEPAVEETQTSDQAVSTEQTVAETRSEL
jgi:hypothetical protein